MKYRKQLYLGYDDSGKIIRKWISADSKAELKEKIARFQTERQLVDNPSEITFRKYSEQWIQTYKSHRAKQTQEMYRFALRRCAPLGPVPVKKISKSMCQEVINEAWQYPFAAENVADTLKQIFRAAIDDGIISRNPAAGLSLPKKPQKQHHLLTKEELDAVDRADLSDQDRFFVRILQVFGLRPAEALALQKTDFDFKTQTLHISKAVELANDNVSAIKSTKTEAVRDIPIPKELVGPLRDRFQGISGFLLFPKADGSLYTKSAYRRLSERVLKAINAAMGGNSNMNLIPDVTLYSFRHRRATDLYYLTQRGKLSTKRAAYLMGHSEMIFLKTYSHIDMEQESENIYQNLNLQNW